MLGFAFCSCMPLFLVYATYLALLIAFALLLILGKDPLGNIRLDFTGIEHPPVGRLLLPEPVKVLDVVVKVFGLVQLGQLKETIQLLAGEDLSVGRKAHIYAVLNNRLTGDMEVDVHVVRGMHP